MEDRTGRGFEATQLIIIKSHCNVPCCHTYINNNTTSPSVSLLLELKYEDGGGSARHL